MADEKVPKKVPAEAPPYTVLDPKKTRGSDIVDFWISEMEKADAKKKPPVA